MVKKNVVIVNPPKIFNPYETWLTIGTPSLCPGGNWINPEDLIICAQLRNMGCDIIYIDGENKLLKLTEVAKLIIDSEPNYVIMNSESIDYARSPLSSYENVNTIADIVKTELFETKLILYGCHSIIDPLGISDSFDFVIKGEGETIIPKLISGENIDEQQIHMADLDKLPIPAYDLVEDVKTNCSEFAGPNLIGKFAQVITSRGCSYSCVFCVRLATGKTVRKVEPKKVYEELKYLSELGYESIYFIDDVWGIDNNWAQRVCHLISELELKWTCQTRANIMCNKELVESMKKAGCINVGLGIETYSDHVLTRVSKIQNTKIIDKAISILSENDIGVIAFLMIGLPETTKADIDATDKFIEKHGFAGAGGFLATPYPQTGMWTGKGNVIESLRRAGLSEYCGNSLGLFDDISARQYWRYYDKKWGGKYNILDQIKKYRPNIYAQWLKYIKEMNIDID